MTAVVTKTCCQPYNMPTVKSITMSFRQHFMVFNIRHYIKQYQLLRRWCGGGAGWGLPLKKPFTLKQPTLRRSTDSLSRRVRMSSEKGSRSVRRSSSPFSRSLWRLEGFDLMTPSTPGSFLLEGSKSVNHDNLYNNEQYVNICMSKNVSIVDSQQHMM